MKLTEDNPKATPTLDWYADSVSIVNPTQNIVLLRAGGSDVPSSAASSDVWVPPYTAQTYPVHAREFAVALGGQALAAPVFNSLYPQSVEVLFSVGEPIPTYSGISIGNVAAAQQAVFVSPQRNAVGPYVDRVPLFPGIRTLTFPRIGSSVLTIRVAGATTGRTYYWSGAGIANYGGWGFGFPNIVFPVNSDVDSSVDISIQVGSAHSYKESQYELAGFQEVYSASVTASDGRLLVDPIDPNSGYVPIGPNSTNVPILARPYALSPGYVTSDHRGLLSSGAYPTPYGAPSIYPHPYRGIRVYADVTNMGGSANYRFFFDSYSPSGGQYSTDGPNTAVLTITATGKYALEIGSGAGSDAGVRNMLVPGRVRVSVFPAAGSPTITMTLEYELIP